ncbi:MAG: ABC transporter permease [Anaerolineae bacterium]|nr:ABC transporter permease [Anaerolineae bacterium]
MATVTNTAESPESTADLRAVIARLAKNGIVRSLIRAVLVGFGIMVIAFTLIRLIPGDPVMILLGDQATPESIVQYRAYLGLNGTIPEQFISYISGILRGDLGTSVVTQQPVMDTVTRRLPVTLWLIGVTVIMALVLALPIGVLAALYRRGWFGQVFRISASVLLATPVFFSGVVAILVISMQLGLAPVAWSERNSAFPNSLRYLWLPGLVLCTVLVPILARVLQSSIVDTLEQEFVESAVVRGLPRRIVVWRYLLRPSLAPTVALLGYMIGALLGAAVVVELVFNIPGIGTALIDAVLKRDYSMVQGILFVFGFIVVLVSFFSDVVSGWLDPRTKAT